MISTIIKNLKYVLGFGPRLIRKYTLGLRMKIAKYINSKKVLRELVKKVDTWLKQIVSKKEASKSDYKKIGTRYFSKRLLLILFALAVIFPIVFYNYLLPQMSGTWWEATLKIDNKRLESFNGRAKVLDSDGKLIFRGEFQAGRINGYGKLYKDDILVYEGEFKNGDYSGTGTKYSEATGEVVYKGQFLNNNYNGEGIAYFEKVKKYEGNFVNGSLNGEGRFLINNKLIYEGLFKDGLYSGVGKLYTKDGILVYEGMFDRGLYEGQGILYYDNLSRIKYEGLFQAGKFNGEGKLYNEQSNLVYQGLMFDGDIDYIKYINQEVDVVRAAFGTEQLLDVYDYSFLAAFFNVNMAIECDFALEYDQPILVKRILLYQRFDSFDGVKIGNSIEDYNHALIEMTEEELSNSYAGVSWMLMVKKLKFEDARFYTYDKGVAELLIVTDATNHIIGISIEKVK